MLHLLDKSRPLHSGRQSTAHKRSGAAKGATNEHENIRTQKRSQETLSSMSRPSARLAAETQRKRHKRTKPGKQLVFEAAFKRPATIYGGNRMCGAPYVNLCVYL